MEVFTCDVSSLNFAQTHGRTRKKARVNAKELRAMNRRLFQRKAFKYDELKSFHELWIQYASEFFEIDRVKQLLSEGAMSFDPSDATYATFLSK